MREIGWRLTSTLRLLLWLLPVAVLADDFQISGLEARLVDDAYVVDAVIDYNFSEEALDALQNGVPLTLEMHLQLRRDRAWIWESDLVDVRLRYQVRHHALTGLYQVVDLQSKGKQNFATREAALVALGRLSDVPLIKQEKLRSGESYRLSLKSALDIEALPLPLRPMAYLSSAWNLSSDRSIWSLKP
ncbi:MAG: DUF4390 domain-containing protein [Sedimenticola sp.]